MITLKKIWIWYKHKVTENCTDDLVANTSLVYWQNKLFAASVIYLIPISLITIIPGLYMVYIEDLAGLFVSDIVTITIVLSVAFYSGWEVKTRKILFNGALYLTSTVLLFYLGSFGPGLLYLLAITVFVVLSLGKVYGYIAVGLNTLICAIIGILIYYDYGNFEVIHGYGVDTWIAVSSNLIFLSAVSVYIIPILFDGLQTAIIRENNLRTDLELEEAQLSQTVDKLNEKNQELEQFAYSISHDLKEPLRMVKSFMGLLQKKYGKKLDEKANQYIHFAVDGADRMQLLIDDLLDYSRVGRSGTEKVPVDFNSVLEDVEQNLGALITQHEAEIHIDHTLPEVSVFRQEIIRVFQNLISNGIKFHKPDGKPVIHVNCFDKQTHWQFEIRDNGIGIPEENLNEIFEIFRRLHSGSEYPGTGIGLAITKKIIDRHGGKLWVESEVDVGSSFFFTLKK